MCMTTETRAAFLWVEKGGGEGCRDIEGFPGEVASELDVEKGRGLYQVERRERVFWQRKQREKVWNEEVQSLLGEHQSVCLEFGVRNGMGVGVAMAGKLSEG